MAWLINWLNTFVDWSGPRNYNDFGEFVVAVLFSIIITGILMVWDTWRKDAVQGP